MMTHEQTDVMYVSVCENVRIFGSLGVFPDEEEK